MSIVGTTSLLIMSFGRCYVDLFIPNVEHLSTLIFIFAQAHHLVQGRNFHKNFEGANFYRSEPWLPQ